MLNDYKKTEEEKIYGNIPYLETEEEAAENIADIYEQRDNKARTFAPPHNVDDNTRKKDNFDDIEESDEEIEESDEEIEESGKEIEESDEEFNEKVKEYIKNFNGSEEIKKDIEI